MNKTRVLLSVEHEQMLELLCGAYADCPYVDIVGVSIEPVECMRLIAGTKPQLWIHSWEDGPEIQGLLSHIYQFHPSLAVVRLHPDESAGYMQMQINSLPDLLKLSRQSPLLALDSA